MVQHMILFQIIPAAFCLMIVMSVIMMSFMGLIVIRKNKAVRRLSLLRPIFVQMLKNRTSEVAATMVVPDLVGDPMDIQVPLYRIEKVRRELVRNGQKKHLLLMSILVCTAYEDVPGFKNEIIISMKDDLESLGLKKEAEHLADLCKFPVSAFTFFKILSCIMASAIVPASLFDELRKNSERHAIERDVNTIRKFNIIVVYVRFFGLVIPGLLLSGILYLYAGTVPEWIIWIMLLIVMAVSGLILGLTIIIDKKISIPLTCEDIETDIKSSVPLMKIRT